MPQGKKRGYITQPDEFGLQARYAYEGKKHSKYFRFSAGNARRKAERWLDRMRREVAGIPALHRKTIKDNHSTGTVGVSRGVSGNGYCYIRVNYSLHGKTKYKTFGFGMAETYASKDEAIAMMAAKDFRAAYVKARDTGQDFDPKAWDDWRARFA